MSRIGITTLEIGRDVREDLAFFGEGRDLGQVTGEFLAKVVVVAGFWLSNHGALCEILLVWSLSFPVTPERLHRSLSGSLVTTSSFDLRTHHVLLK